MRESIWQFARRGVPLGQILPAWLLAVRAAIYPIEFLQWRLTRWHGWHYESDEYRLYGIRISQSVVRALAESDGEVYRITRHGEVVTLERLPNNQ